MKRPYNTKSKPVTMRLSEQARGYLEEMQAASGVSRTEMVEIAIFEMYHAREKWAICPACGRFSCLPMIIPVAEAFENVCPHCGHKHTVNQ